VSATFFSRYVIDVIFAVNSGPSYSV